MISVSQLFRHPVKSLTPEAVEHVRLTTDGRIMGDRVLGFRFGDAGDRSDWKWQNKNNFVGLVNTPGLAELHTVFDDANQRLRISTRDVLLAEGSIHTPADRQTIEDAFTNYVLTLDHNPLAGHPERQPVNLVGDGKQPLFHDTAAGLVTLHGQESLAALGSALGDDALDGRRFRSNIVVAGLNEPFQEMTWISRRIRIGATEFKVVKPVKRCLVTHANPVSGKRDRDVMGALVDHFTPESPQFSVILQAITDSGTVSVGEEIALLN